jgi:hypothetical protein
VRKTDLAPKINFSKLWLSLRPVDEVALTSYPIIKPLSRKKHGLPVIRVKAMPRSWFF